MKKILLTGMTSSHCSRSSNERSLSFSGAVNIALSSSEDIDVVWGQPSVAMTREFLEQFDSVLVGVSPLTSLSANYVYGPLKIISEMKDSPKLSLFIDTSTPRHLGLSLENFSSDPDKFFKPVFDSRKQTEAVRANKELFDQIVEATRFLAHEAWPQAFYASLPWKSIESVNIPANAKENVRAVNLDAFLIDRESYQLNRSDKWVVDNYKSRWAQKALSAHSLPDSPMKWNRGVSDSQVMEQICRSVAVMIAPDDRDGTFWNYRYAQALTTETPVATYWPESGVLSESWAVLSSKIDTMSSSERDSLAKDQKSFYVKSILGQSEALENLKYYLRVD